MKIGIEKYRDYILLLLLFLMLSTISLAQNLTGHWQGVFNNDHLNGKRDPYFLNMVLYQEGRKVEGRFSTALMDYRDHPMVVYEISGTLGKKEKIPQRLMVGNILYNKLMDGVAEYFLEFADIHYLKNDTMELLYGSWFPNGIGRRSDGSAGTFWVRKLYFKDTAQNSLTNPEMVSNLQAPVIKSDSLLLTEQMVNRKNVPQGNIVVNSRKLTLQLYDNGIVDDDSVSVFFNGKLLLSHQRITEKPIVLNIELDEQRPSNQLTLFAENLGKIPPNTALIVVMAGDKRYELYSKTNLDENAVMRFTYQPN